MTFKKTSEGRVFFQGSNSSSGADIRKSMKSQVQPTVGNPTQLQILTLLKSLNEKLKATQSERNAMRTELETYRRVIEELEIKSERSDRAFQLLEQKVQGKGSDDRGGRAEKMAQETLKELEETRKLILDLEEKTERTDKELIKKQTQLEKLSTTGYSELIKRMQASEQKVEEIGSQHARLTRQVDKAIEDRTRFMRKIERIEETVIQTRDALNAKAMVLLTGQNVPGSQSQADIELSEREELAALTAAVQQDSELPWWRRSMRLQAVGVIVLVVGGILAGWAVSEIQRPPLPDIGDLRISEQSSQLESDASRAPAPSTETTETTAEINPPENKWQVDEDTSAFSEETNPAENSAQDAFKEKPVKEAAVQKPDAADDIGTLDLNDEAKLIKALEENPDALAAELNKIEPSTPDPETAKSAEKPIEVASIPEAKPQEKAPEPVQEKKEVEAASPAKKSSSKELRDAMRPDSNLPDVIKKVETQAYEGSPEAQHDLGAIYTAGHAGVKQDYKRALFWFEQAANGGIANAAYNIGVLHHQGLGTKPDINKAISWYKRAADLGHPEAQYNLGIAYIEGVGVSYDPVKANDYFKKAAAQGIMEASYNLGLIYENGLLGKPQPDEALMWYKEAADKGSPEARAALEQLAKTLGIGLDEVNRLVENVRSTKKGGGETAPAKPQKQTENTIKTPTSNTQIIAQVQDYLMSAGLFPGPADGSDGPLLTDAVRAYQAMNKLEVTGLANDELLKYMLSNSNALEENGSRQ